MKISIKKIFSLLFIFGILLHSGCSLFHKKNKCNDCPKWNKIETTKTSQKQI